MKFARILSLLVLFFLSTSLLLARDASSQTTCSDYSDTFSSLNSNYWMVSPRTIGADAGTYTFNTDDGNLTGILTDVTVGRSLVFVSKTTYPSDFTASADITEATFTDASEIYSDITMNYSQDTDNYYLLRYKSANGVNTIDLLQQIGVSGNTLKEVSFNGSLPLRLSLQRSGQTLTARYNNTVLISTTIPSAYSNPTIDLSGFTETDDPGVTSDLTFSFDNYSLVCGSSAISELPQTAIMKKDLLIVLGILLITLTPFAYFFSAILYSLYTKHSPQENKSRFELNVVQKF